ncbi:hypothetical protein [Aquifex sp.]
MEIYPIHLLLSRLEEEIEYQQKIATTYLVGTPRYSQEVVENVHETLKRISSNIKLVSLILGELEEIQEKELREEALILSSESLSLISLLLPAMERFSPFFLQEIKVENKPILERLEEVIAEIENAIEKLELSSSVNLTRTLENLASSLEIHLQKGKKIAESEI